MKKFLGIIATVALGTAFFIALEKKDYLIVCVSVIGLIASLGLIYEGIREENIL